MTPFSIEAVVVGGVDYGDADRIVYLLSAERGRISAYARGAKNSKRRFAGALDLFTRVQAQLAQRPGADLFSLHAADVIDARPGISTDLLRIAHAGYACELARELSREAHENTKLYARLSEFLDALARAAAAADALCLFELRALEASGLAPSLDSCARCGGALGTSPGFDPAAGGATCARCTPPGLRASAAAVARLLALARGQPPAAERAAESRAMVRRFTLHQLGKSLKSLTFLAEMERTT